jgi:hypothetical protein
MALGILETAYRQMCSQQHAARFLPGIPRQLHGVHVTYPSGWSEREINLYKRKWSTALRIFHLNHRDTRSDGVNEVKPPLLYMDTDEAMVSQLPFVYEEICRFGKSWIELVGRGKGSAATVRVMSIDVGGGTTDYSIVEYRDRLDNPGVDLSATLLFRDSSSVAGDLLVKNLIERVILPNLGQDFYDDPARRAIFEETVDPQVFDYEKKEKWKRATRLALVPLANRLLALRVLHPEAKSLQVNLDAVNIYEMQTIQNDLETLLGKDLRIMTKRLACSAELFESCVRDTFGVLFDAITEFLVGFAVDLVVVNGKPTEISDVTQLLREKLPIPNNRILTAKQFPIRGWYPFRSQGKIEDAKTVTVVGAALYRALKAQLVLNWKVDFFASRQLRTRNYWVYVGDSVDQPDKPYLKPSQDENEFSMLVNGHIGRQLVLGAATPEPVYQLRWAKHVKDAAEYGNANVRITLRRIMPPESADTEIGSTKAEYLEIVKASGTTDCNGQLIKITEKDLRLKLCLLPDGLFWMDDPKFRVSWSILDWLRPSGAPRVKSV